MTPENLPAQIADNFERKLIEQLNSTQFKVTERHNGKPTEHLRLILEKMDHINTKSIRLAAIVKQ